ncbi:uncharacterized protein LOC106177204 [Lingula anatina]|uniref:Uncharacterized protein LOC106177204 n=1 Tax=Lingula anatina TaxID=7574 RepID=A0A2R2MS05_LINAN|nr:uncharacterized protein LOC106177204 [Lingula anatina]|eukprot:XP_023933041.1 uncharacterized protein LOC106177204 [Lingula anatina]
MLTLSIDGAVQEMSVDMETENNKEEQRAPMATVRIVLKENILKAKIVGRGTALGTWDTQRGVNLARCTELGVPVLRAEVLLPKAANIEWKFVRPQNPYHPGSGWIWEPEPFRNRCLQVTTKDSMEVICTWGELDMEIKESNYTYEPEVHTSGKQIAVVTKELKDDNRVKAPNTEDTVDTKDNKYATVVKTLSIEEIADIKDANSVSLAEDIKNRVDVKDTKTVMEDVKERAPKDRRPSRWRRLFNLFTSCFRRRSRT